MFINVLRCSNYNFELSFFLIYTVVVYGGLYASSAPNPTIYYDMNADHFKSGLNKLKVGLVDQAIEEFEKAAWEDPENFEVQFNLGTAYLSIGEFEQSIVNLTRALQINQKNSDALGNRAVAYLAIGDEKKSEKDKIEAIRNGAPPDGINAVLEIVREKRIKSDPFKNIHK